eukprot:4280919-Heterocapsa_arctica.AAC.1
MSRSRSARIASTADRICNSSWRISASAIASAPRGACRVAGLPLPAAAGGFRVEAARHQPQLRYHANCLSQFQR